jgi:hypothetical protein
MTKIEETLLKMVENFPLKKAYIGNRISHFSKTSKEITSSNISSKLKKKLLGLYFKEVIIETNKSQLVNDELSFLQNILKARYRKFLNNIKVN